MDQVIIWTESATADLESIVEYICRDSEFYAASIARELVSAASSLATLAGRGRTVPEYQNVQIKELIVRRYRVIYRIGSDHIEVLRIIHSARHLPPVI